MDLESLGQLTRGIVHDLNHITATIRGFASFVERDTRGMSDHPKYRNIRESVEAITAAVGEAEALCLQLAGFASADGDGSISRVTRVNDSLLTMRVMLCAPAVEVIWDLRLDDDAAVEIDDGGFRQILLNLAFNARDAMPTGGELRIQTFEVAGHACLRVTDTGVGMSEETRKHIFEPFFTTKPRHQGTGLGMSTVYGIIKRADGRVRVNSDAEGTDVLIALPLASPPSSASDRDRTSSDACSR